MDNFQDITEYKIYDNKSIKDLLYYDGICYWWFIDFGIYNYILSDTCPCKNQSILQRMVWVLTDHFYPLMLLLSSIIYLVHLIIDKIVKFMYASPPLFHNAIMYYFIDWEWRFDLKTQSLRNIYHSSIIENLLPQKQVNGIYDIGLLDGLTFTASKDVHSKEKRPLLPATDSMLYWSYSCYNKANKSRKYFKSVWKILDHDQKWFDLWSQKTGWNKRLLKRMLKHLLLFNLPLAVERNQRTANIIEKEQPSVLVMRNEQMVSGRSWVYLSRKNHIPTIGIQHGEITNHPAYLYHDSSNVSSNDKDIGISFPVPTVTCVWGQAEYDLLVHDAGYPDNQVIVTGNPRYDHLGYADDLYSRTEFCKRYSIDSTTKIVLWLTQSHGFSVEENTAYLKEVFSTFQDMENVTLIIKQHPMEKKRDRDLIDEYCHLYKLNIPLIILDKMADTTECIYISDVIINKHSTAGQEAIAFHKPMIILDFSTVKDIGDYVKEGVAFPVYEPGYLQLILSHIFSVGCDDISANQDLYIKRHLYKIDGLAAQRVAEVINLYCV